MPWYCKAFTIRALSARENRRRYVCILYFFCDEQTATMKWNPKCISVISDLSYRQDTVLCTVFVPFPPPKLFLCWQILQLKIWHSYGNSHRADQMIYIHWLEMHLLVPFPPPLQAYTKPKVTFERWSLLTLWHKLYVKIRSLTSLYLESPIQPGKLMRKKLKSLVDAVS